MRFVPTVLVCLLSLSLQPPNAYLTLTIAGMILVTEIVIMTHKTTIGETAADPFLTEALAMTLSAMT